MVLEAKTVQGGLTKGSVELLSVVVLLIQLWENGYNRHCMSLPSSQLPACHLLVLSPTSPMKAKIDGECLGNMEVNLKVRRKKRGEGE